MHKSSISELTRLIPPPITPVAAHGEWRPIEESLGLALPEDYKMTVEVYGTGRFFGFLWIYSPFDSSETWSFAHQVRLAAENMRCYKADGFDVSFAVYPEAGGLLNFGSTANGNLLNWVTVGEPNRWGLAIWDPDYLAIRPLPDLTLSSLLCELARGRNPVTPDGELFPADVLLSPGFVSETHVY